MSSGWRYWTNDNWSPSLQAEWLAATDPGDGLQAGGIAGALAPRTLQNMELAFGRYYAFVKNRALLCSARSVDEYFDLPTIRAFVMEELAGLAPMTKLLILSALHRTFCAMAPSLDTTDLKHVIRRFHQIARPIREIDTRLVPPTQLIEAAESLFDEAVEDPVQKRRSARKARDGAIILIGAFHGLRRENVRIGIMGVNFLLDEGRIFFPAAAMKGRRDFDVAMAPEVSARLREYREVYRKRLLDDDAVDEGYLFPSASGKALSPLRLSQIVEREVYRRTGRRFAFHMFRYSAATFVADQAPQRLRIAQHLLHHRRLRTTSRHYIRGQQRRAGSKYQEAVKRFIKAARRRLSRKARKSR